MLAELRHLHVNSKQCIQWRKVVRLFFTVCFGKAIEQLRYKIDKNELEAKLVGGPEVKSADNRSVEQRIEEIKRKRQLESEKDEKWCQYVEEEDELSDRLKKFPKTPTFDWFIDEDEEGEQENSKGDEDDDSEDDEEIRILFVTKNKNEIMLQKLTVYVKTFLTNLNY